VVAGLSIVEPLAVEQDESAAEIAATDGDVGLDAARGALLEIDRGVKLQDVRQSVEQECVASDGKSEDGAVELVERERLKSAGHYDGFMLLGESRCNGNEQEN
jgi:hypothetical protein